METEAPTLQTIACWLTTDSLLKNFPQSTGTALLMDQYGSIQLPWFIVGLHSFLGPLEAVYITGQSVLNTPNLLNITA